MHVESNLLRIFLYNVKEAYRSAVLLLRSYPRVGMVAAQKTDFISGLSIDDLDKLDAFRVRFCDLQDALGNKVFRSLLMLELEVFGSNLDILNKIEKRGLVPSFDEWQEIRNVRNLFVHDYPETEEARAQILSRPYNLTPSLIDVLNRVLKYAAGTIKIDLKEFPILTIE